MRLAHAVAALACSALAACLGLAPMGPMPAAAGSGSGSASAPKVSWHRVMSPGDVSREPPAAGAYRIHLIDVGTGLSILIQGHDFAMLYDAGSNDRDETPLRVLAYLAAALGPSGDDLCVERGAPPPTGRVALPNVVLSHPHFDHGSAMDLVIHCYDVANLWDSGRVTDTAFYRDLIAAVARSTATTYHTASEVPTDHVHSVKGLESTIARWERFGEGDVVALGDGARFTILHAEGKKLPDPNQNSIVLAVQLGTTRLLLVGDALSGERHAPSAAPGEVEAFLLEQHAAALRADILQVGHHGSKTSSRHAFLAAVQPSLALVSSGPKEYGHTVLPDAEVIDELRNDGATVLRTDDHDAHCELAQRIGGATGPGGCDSYIIEVQP
jgi:competence protein ComEC